MDPYEIYIAYISWGNDGKRRPILFIEEDNGYARVFRVTSQYANKSDDIKAQYLEITDWQQAGLSKLSYIDAGEKMRIPLALICSKPLIGKLSKSDKQRLLEFLSK